jgi:hypothetical protein
LRPQLRNYLLAGKTIGEASQTTIGAGQSEIAQATIDVGRTETTPSNVEP